MAFNNSFTAVTGATFTAAQYNTYVRDNFTAMWVYTTAGDIVYATSSTALNRLALSVGGVLYGGASAPAWLAKPTVDSVLKNTSAGTPSWYPFKFDVHAIAHVEYDAATQDITSASFVDITNATLNIVTTKICTLLIIGTGTMGVDTSGKSAVARAMIDGTAPSGTAGTAGQTSTGVGVYPFTVIGKKINVAAGTITGKLQAKISSAGGHVYCGPGSVLLVAIGE